MSEYIDTEGRRVEVHMTDGDDTYFYPAGGGFAYKMPTAVFNERFKPAPARLLTRGTVTAEFLVDDDSNPVSLPCWSDGSLWNGWGMPAFSHETVNELIRLQPGMLKWDGDNVVAVMQDENEVYKMEVAPDGTRMWPIGAGSWCWDAVDFSEGEKKC